MYWLMSYVTLPSLLIYSISLIVFELFKNDEPGNISTELFLYKLIIDKGVQDIFHNVAIALRMYLVWMVTM